MPKNSAGSDGCFSIPDLIVSGKTEILRVEECIDPVFLVPGQQRIDYWQKPAKDQECTSELLRAQRKPERKKTMKIQMTQKTQPLPRSSFATIRI